MIHRILGYLWYKTQKMTRYMDTSSYTDIHVPFIFSTTLMLYEACFALLYWAITGINPRSYCDSDGEYIAWCFGICVIQWIAVYAYYRYKRRYLKIAADKSYEKYPNIWAILFLVLPFVLLITLAMLGDKLGIP